MYNSQSFPSCGRMDVSCLILVLVLILTVLYYFLTKEFNYWKKQNVPSVPNPLPGFGNIFSIIFIIDNFPDFISRAYSSTKASVIGFYFLKTPSIIVRDPELIKCVLQTNFLSFRENAITLNEKTDPVMAQNPFFTHDMELWKESRARVVGHFSGKKLRYLFTIIDEVCSKMCVYVDRQIKNNGFFECELKDHFSKYTGEIVANAAFGMEGESFSDHPSKMAFTSVAKTLFAPTLINVIKFALLFYLPKLALLFNVSFLDRKAEKYFRKNIEVILKERKQNNIKPNDFMQFCLDMNPEENLDKLIADIILFYGDVYETSSITLSSVFYLLSLNKDIQEKLRKHILSTMESSGGEINYESLRNMNYLDQVISESMRLMPAVPVTTKRCTEEITLTGSDGLQCHLLPGHRVYIPLKGLHNDSEHWDNPEVYNPDNFSPEKQANRNKYVFIPFGEGPRMCVGMRLGLLVVKLATAKLISKYSVEFSSKTKTPLQQEPTFLTMFKGGLWAKFTKLN